MEKKNCEWDPRLPSVTKLTILSCYHFTLQNTAYRKCLGMNKQTGDFVKRRKGNEKSFKYKLIRNKLTNNRLWKLELSIRIYINCLTNCLAICTYNYSLVSSFLLYGNGKHENTLY